jgi:hypothetical protein
VSPLRLVNYILRVPLAVLDSSIKRVKLRIPSEVVPWRTTALFSHAFTTLEKPHQQEGIIREHNSSKRSS